MSDVVANPQTTAGESKSARKKKAKSAVVPEAEKSTSELGTASSEQAGKSSGTDSGENSYLKELQRCVLPACGRDVWMAFTY